MKRKINKAEKYIQRKTGQETEQVQTNRYKTEKGKISTDSIEFGDNFKKISPILIAKLENIHVMDKNQRNTKFYGNWHKKE